MAAYEMASFLFLVTFSFCLLQASRCQFVFDVWLDAIVNINDCYDSLEVIHPPCETYLPKFCLREGRTVSNARSLDLNDCPLGRVGRFGPEGALPIIKPINSTFPWTRNFQLYVTAKDKDDGNPDDDRDDIFVDMTLEVSNHYTTLMSVTGERGNVQLIMKFRVMCHENHYGGNCTVFCEAQDSDVNGHYSCNSDGSLHCLEGYENPENQCRDVIDPCASTPCANNGSCTAVSPYKYTCQCLPSHSGSHCEVEMVESATSTPSVCPACQCSSNCSEHNFEEETVQVISLQTSSSSGTTTAIVLLGILCFLALLISGILLVIVLRTKISFHPLSRSQRTKTEVKREGDRNLESSMQTNFLYNSNQPAADSGNHGYEIVTSFDTTTNTMPNDRSGVQNPMFEKSEMSTSLATEDEQLANAPPEYIYSNPRDNSESRYISRRINKEMILKQSALQSTDERSTSVIKDEPNSHTSTAGASYNKLNHGADVVHPQPRLAKVEGLGYDALDN